jgi:outer membrane receptor protein involved in Fe transport
MTALYAMDEKKDHMLRFSFAKAFRTPFTSVRETETHRVPFPSPPYPPGLYAFNVLPADELKNEEIYSLEAGYTGKLTRNLLLRADTYYQRYEKLIGYTKTYDGFGIPYSTPENIDGADSYGAELELVLAGKPGKISAWYAYEDFQKDAPQRSIRSYAPAKHKVGLSGRLFLSDGWTFNTNYRYTTTTFACKDDATLVDAGPSHRLDLGLAKEFAKGNGEVMVGVSDVLNKTNGPHFGSGQLSANETPGRTFFVRLQLKF